MMPEPPAQAQATPQPEPCPELVDALAVAHGHVQAAHDALQDVSARLHGERGEYWRAGCLEVCRSEAAARQALHHVRAADALVRLSIQTEPVELMKVYERPEPVDESREP